MLGLQRLIDRGRLLAPAEHLGVLIEPAAAQIRAWLDGSEPDDIARARVAGQPVSEWRAELHADLGLTGPILATGHQLEFNHAGVVAKNFALDHLCRQSGASPLYVAVDSDIPKAVRLVAPRVRGGRWSADALPIPGRQTSVPLEYQPHAPRSQWADFFADCSAGLEECCVPQFAGAWLDAPEPLDACQAMCRADAALEARLGLGAIPRVRISELSAKPAFAAFVWEIAHRAAEFRETYNSAQAEYRAAFRERNPMRPAPPLGISGDRIETPFWARGREDNRAPLYVEPCGSGMRLYAGEKPLGDWPASGETEPADLAAQLRAWGVRPRALSLSAFLRMFVADVFIHGIGGAKYDAMMEPVVDRFFGAAPRAMACVTATAQFAPRPDDQALSNLQRTLRDITQNPQRFVGDELAGLVQIRQNLVDEIVRLRRETPWQHERRRDVNRRIRALNARLSAGTCAARRKLETAIEAELEELKAGQAASWREYWYAFHSMHTLRELRGRVQALLGD